MAYKPYSELTPEQKQQFPDEAAYKTFMDATQQSTEQVLTDPSQRVQAEVGAAMRQPTLPRGTSVTPGLALQAPTAATTVATQGLTGEVQAVTPTPTTAPTQIYEHFLTILRRFDIDELRNKINRNSELIVDAIGEEKIIGKNLCPVITIPKEYISDELAVKWNLYGLQTQSKNYQIFTYSCDDKDYENFAKELSNENIVL